MKIFKLYILMFKFERSNNGFDYTIKRRLLFFWFCNRNVALVTIIPESSYSLISLENLSPSAVQYICDKIRKIANI